MAIDYDDDDDHDDDIEGESCKTGKRMSTNTAE